MHVNVGNEATVIDGVESDVNFPVEGVVVGEGGEVHRISDERRGVGSHEGGGHEGPSIGDAIQAMAAAAHVVAMVDIVMVKLDVMRVALGSILEGEFITILDVIFKMAVVHDEPFRFVSYLLLVLAVGGLISKGGCNLS